MLVVTHSEDVHELPAAVGVPLSSRREHVRRTLPARASLGVGSRIHAQVFVSVTVVLAP